MKLIVFSASIEGEDGKYTYYATAKEAKAEAREYARSGYALLDVEVVRHVTPDLPARELAALLLNHRGWSAVRKTIAVYKAIAREGEA